MPELEITSGQVIFEAIENNDRVGVGGIWPEENRDGFSRHIDLQVFSTEALTTAGELNEFTQTLIGDIARRGVELIGEELLPSTHSTKARERKPQGKHLLDVAGVTYTGRLGKLVVPNLMGASAYGPNPFNQGAMPELATGTLYLTERIGISVLPSSEEAGNYGRSTVTLSREPAPLRGL